MLVITLRRELAMQEALRDLHLSELFARAFPNESDEHEAPPSNAGSGADPQLLAMVADLLEARRKLNDPSVPDGPEADALGERETDLSIAVHRFPARSIHDMAAKLPFLREEAEDAARGWDGRRVPFEASLPGAAWAGLLRDIQHLAGVAPAVQAKPDPVHPLIAEHRAAYAEWDRLSAVWADQISGTPQSVAADTARAPSGAREVASLKALTQARPTTFAGLLALVEYLPDALRQVDQREDAESVLRNVAASLRMIATPPQAAHAAPAADLSNCSVRHLARLYETISARWHMASLSMGAPFLWDGDNYSAAGRILDNECDRLAEMMENIAREMKGREASDEEGDDRLAVLVRQDIEGSGCVTDRALLAEINAVWRA